MPNVTLEGDNMVMAQQTARGILKVMKKVSQGKKGKGLSAYLNNTQDLISKKCAVTS